MRKNAPYPFYAVEKINNLKDLLLIKEASVPEKLAVIYNTGKEGIRYISFGELSASVKEAGTFLLLQGFQKTNIAILSENSFEWLVWFLAIANSGNVAVAMDKEMQNDELRELLISSNIRMILCSETQLKRLKCITDGTEIILVSLSDSIQLRNKGKTIIEHGNSTFSDTIISGDDACCIFFTSGTTGKRKGVVLTHNNIASDIAGSCALFKPDGGTYAVLPFHHAFGLIVGVLMFLHYGKSVFIGSGIRYFRKEMNIAKPQTMMLVPLFVETMYKQICDTVRKEGKQDKLKNAIRISDKLMILGIDIRKYLFRDILNAFGGNLKYIISGGAPIETKYIRIFRSFGVEILNGFGTTECSPVVSVNRSHHHKDGSVGLQIPGSSIRINEDGEVLVSGPHVMQGYYGNKEATDAVLENGWYKTGDLGTVDKDGFLTLTGRKKNIIILSNGENVSPEPLEQSLLQIQGIKEVIVYGIKGVLGAEIYAEKSDDDLKKQIRKQIDEMNKKLPVYQRINKVVFRNSEFDKTTTMKIKR